MIQMEGGGEHLSSPRTHFHPLWPVIGKYRSNAPAVKIKSPRTDRMQYPRRYSQSLPLRAASVLDVLRLEIENKIPLDLIREVA